MEWHNQANAYAASEIVTNNRREQGQTLAYHFRIMCCPNRFRVVRLSTSLGQLVNFEIISSMAKVMPRTRRQLPTPFHSVVTPCRLCKCTMLGRRLNGCKW